MKHLLVLSVFLVIGLLTVSSCKKEKEKEIDPEPPPPPELEGIVINGVRWATCNVDMPGVFATNPEDAGMFYQWNRKVGWSSTDPMINSDGGTQWDNTYPPGDWDPENDPCPLGWRMPTMKELESLAEAKPYFGELKGVPGCFFGDKSNPLFLPAPSGRGEHSGMLNPEGSEYRKCGFYWGSSVNHAYKASRLGLNYSVAYIETEYVDRRRGFCVRCVAAENKSAHR